MDKRGDQATRGDIPQLCCSVPARRQDPSTIGAKCGVVDLVLMVKGDDQLSGSGVPALFHDGRLVPERIVLKRLDFVGKT